MRASRSSTWVRGAHLLARRAGAPALALAALLALPAAPLAAPPPTGRVLVVPLDGPVTPVMADGLVRAIRRAERDGYEALVLEIDTPGGLESSMRDMVRAELAAKIPVLAWVTPSGGRAASAGVFVTLAADVAAMAPGTNIGAATPISMQGPMDSTLARKATNDAAAFARTVALQRGRNAVWAERAVREAVAVDEREALRLGVVDFTAGTLEELLAEADGRTWRRGETSRVMHLKGDVADRLEPGLLQRILALIAEPNVAYILLMLGFYGVLFELQNPGAVLPGVVGAISLILAFLALSTLPVNTAGIALIALAVVFFIAEVKVASHGVLAAGGILSMLLGSLILFRGEASRLSWGVIVGATLATTVFFLGIVGVGLRARRRPVATGIEGLRGVRGQALERIALTGRIRVKGEIWNARSDHEIEAGDAVEVTGGERLTLHVRPASREELS